MCRIKNLAILLGLCMVITACGSSEQQKSKDETKAQKVKIRPVIIKDTLEYQVSEFVGRKVLHTNYTQKDVKKRIEKYMEEEFKRIVSKRLEMFDMIQ